MLSPEKTQELKQHYGRKVDVPIDYFYILERDSYGVYLFGDIEQEKPMQRGNFILVSPYYSHVQTGGIVFRYGMIMYDKIDSFSLNERSSAEEGSGGWEKFLKINAETGAKLNSNAGGLFTLSDLERFNSAVKRHHPNAQFLNSRPVTLLREGIHF